MFEWRFRVTPGIISQPLLESAFFAGWGRIPYISRVTVQDGILIVSADATSSGTIHIPIPYKPLGVVMHATESLRSRHEPYHLVRELVRGALGRLYRRLFDWQMLGFVQPQNRNEQIKDIARRFSLLITTDTMTLELEQEFMAILEEISHLILDENREFAEQSLSWRTREGQRLPILLGAGTNVLLFESQKEFGILAGNLRNTFHALLPTPTWRELEPSPGQYNWELFEKRLAPANRFGFKLIFGPLLSFTEETIPEWLLPHLADHGYFESSAAQYVNAVSERYGYLAHGWILANRFMDQSINTLSQERSLALINLLAQQLRSRGIDSPFMVGITQPWGEYALQKTPRWEQVQVAESLMTCQEIDIFLLEMDFGSGKYLTLPRDPMSVGNMIDQWSFLGKKVFVSLSVPSKGSFLENTPDICWSENLQKIWTETLLFAILGKRSVSGIFWSCLQDSMSSTESLLPGFHNGLVNLQQNTKPALKHFSAARNNLLR